MWLIKCPLCFWSQHEWTVVMVPLPRPKTDRSHIVDVCVNRCVSAMCVEATGVRLAASEEIKAPNTEGLLKPS